MTDKQDWQPIETAPRDGSEVYVKRVYECRIVKEGFAVFGGAHLNALMRQPLGLDLLGRLSVADYAREATNLQDNANDLWLNPDRMFVFPTPTHWRPKPIQPIPIITEQAETIARLREALQWYGEQARLARLIGDAGRHALAGDGGNRARAALKPTKA